MKIHLMASIFCCEYLEVEEMIFELVGVLVLDAADTAADDTTKKNTVYLDIMLN